MAVICQIELLGQLRVLAGGQEFTKFRTYKTGALLAFLSYHLGRAVPREELIEMLWPDTSEDQARNSLSQSLSALRHQVDAGGVVLEANRHTLRLNGELCSTDVAEFLRLAKAGRNQEAVAVFQGEFLPGYYEDWISGPREHLREHALGLLDTLRADCRNPREALLLALQSVSIDPTREASHQEAIRLYTELGHFDAAARQYRECERSMRVGLGLAPSEATRALAKAALAKHRDAAPVVEQTPVAPPVPAPMNRIIGREKELAGLEAIFSDRAARLVTLTGPGGLGKTRLSLEFAHSQSDATFVRVEHCDTPSSLWEALAAGLGATTPPKGEPRDAVLLALSHKPTLLVIDNFEQLVDSGGGEALRTVLESVATVRILVTSRRLLNIDGETEFPLSPLPCHTRSPAMELFVQRAQAARPDFEVTVDNEHDIEELCQRLEGIPLAIELAASRAQVMSPKSILSHFNERLDLLSSKAKVERHRSLRQAIFGTYRLLPMELQRAFRALAVFSGGWDEFTARATLGLPSAWDVLSDLREVSMIVSEESSDGRVRFRMLDTLREYGRQEATNEEADQFGDSHAAAMVALCETCERLLEGSDQFATLRRLQDDHSNLDQALAWLAAKRDVDSAMRVCVAVWRYWHLKGHIGAGRRHCEAILALPGGEDVLRARLLNACGRLAYLQGDYDYARSLHDQALALKGSDTEVRALAITSLGAIAYETGDYETALQNFQESRDLRRRQNDRFGEGNALNWIGIVLTDQSRYEEAKALLTESLGVREDLGDTSGIARSLNSLGIVARRLGHLDEAAEYYERSLAIQRVAGDKRAIAGLLSNISMIRHTQGNLAEADRLLREAEVMARETGDKWGIATIVANRALMALERGDLTLSRELQHEALRMRRDIGNQWGLAYSFEGCARTLAEIDPGVAAQCLGAADVVRQSLGSPLPPSEEATMAAVAETLAVSLGVTGFDQNLALGKSSEQHAMIERVLGALTG